MENTCYSQVSSLNIQHYPRKKEIKLNEMTMVTYWELDDTTPYEISLFYN